MPEMEAADKLVVAAWIDAAVACMRIDKSKDGAQTLQSPQEKNSQICLQSKMLLITEFCTANQSF